MNVFRRVVVLVGKGVKLGMLVTGIKETSLVAAVWLREDRRGRKEGLVMVIDRL
jgi:hypothetical protein